MAVREFTLEDYKDLLVSCTSISPSMVIDDPNTKIEDLDVDSASLLAIQLELEERFGVRVGEDDLDHFGTVASTIEFVNRQLQQQQ